MFEAEDIEDSKSGPPWNVSEALYLLEAVYRFKKEMEHVPEPNRGRLEELKERVQNGTLVSDEIVDEVALKMSRIFNPPS